MRGIPIRWTPAAPASSSIFCTARVKAESFDRARQMAERWDETAPVCERA